MKDRNGLIYLGSGNSPCRKVIIMNNRILLLILLFAITSVIARNRTVETRVGKIRGMLKTTMLGNIKYYSFLGIPYAISPTGPLRFKVSSFQA